MSHGRQGKAREWESEPGMGAEWREQGPVSPPPRQVAKRGRDFLGDRGGGGDENAPTATCSSWPEQEPRLRGLVRNETSGKLGQSDGVTANKGLSLREKRRLAEGRTQATRGPRGRRRFLRWGRSPSAGGARWAQLRGGTEGAARRARGGEDSHRPAPPCPWRPRPQRPGGGLRRVSLRRLLRNGPVTSGD